MKIEKGQISSSQLMFLIVCFLQSAHLTISFTYKVTRHDTWLAIIAGFGISFLLVLIYIALARNFPGKNLIEINDIIYGPYLGKLISILYISFFLSLIAPNLYYFSSFWIIHIMPETPRVVFIIMFVFVCAWTVRNGIEVIARCSFIFVIVTALSVFIITILLIKDMNFTNFLPVFDLPLRDFIQGIHIVIAIPFCEIVVFLMVIPYTDNIKKVRSSVLLGLIIGAIQLLIIVSRDTAVLGPLEDIMITPPFASTQLIDIANVLTRLDILVAVVLMVTMFIKVCVLYHASVLGIAQILRLRTYSPLIMPIGIICVNLGMIVFSSGMEQDYSGANIWPFLPIPFEVIIPLLSFIIMKIRRLSK